MMETLKLISLSEVKVLCPKPLVLPGVFFWKKPLNKYVSRLINFELVKCFNNIFIEGRSTSAKY